MQTWLNRKIQGPRQVGEGVKPYIAKDDADYAKRTQMYNDSLAAYNATQNIIKTLGSKLKYEKPIGVNSSYYTNVEGYSAPKKDPYSTYTGVPGVASDINTLRKTDKSLGNKDSVRTMEYHQTDRITSKTYQLPIREKPIQPIKSNRSDVAKMPTKKAALSSSKKISTVKSRTPKYNKPYKTTSGSDKNYATINRSDGTGNKNLSKNEYNAEMRLFKNKK